MTAEQRQNRDWSDLPLEIVSDIAERAGLFELPSLLRVCNAWSSASSATLAQIVKPELDQGPWFLLYEDKNSECQLLTASGKKFTTSLPELVGTTCLAAYHGWLLLYQQGGISMFFFHVFSRQRIDLPEFPVLDHTDHVAAVSSSPTSQDCVVCVISRSNDATLDAKVLYLRDQTWIGSEINSSFCYHGRIFFIKERRDTMSMISVHPQNRSMHLRCVALVKLQDITNEGNNQKQPKSRVPCWFIDDYLRKRFKEMKNLGLTEDVSISTCGASTPLNNIGNHFICDESFRNNAEKSKNRCFKGVWIQPRSSRSSFSGCCY